jgi:hypothetical protein
MKTKKLEKKLVLNKETISNLKIDELRKLAGGISGDPCIIKSIINCTGDLCDSNGVSFDTCC